MAYGGHSTQVNALESRNATDINSATSFFRQPELMLLMRKIIERHNSGEPLRIASVGCSTGQEPYSLLMLSWHFKDRFKMDAYDMNPSNIEQAIKGVYPMYDGYGSTESELETFSRLMDYPGAGGGSIEHLCHVNDDGRKQYRKHIIISDEAKSEVRFYTHNLLERGLPSPPAPYDFVLMFNVLLHYPEAGQNRLLANVHLSMAPEGILFTDMTCCDPLPPFFKETGKTGKTAEYDEYIVGQSPKEAHMQGEHNKFNVFRKA